MRATLTGLGVAIGVAGIVAAVAVMEGFQRYAVRAVREAGAGGDLAVVTVPNRALSRRERRVFLERPHLTVDDLEAAQRACAACDALGGLTALTRPLRWKRARHESAAVMGVTSGLFGVLPAREVQSGRLISPVEIDRGRAVATIGSDVARALFGRVDPVGKSIALGVGRVRIVGVTVPKGRVLGVSQDDFIWVPLGLHRKLFGEQSLSLHARVADDALLVAEAQIRAGVRHRRGLRPGAPDDFSFETPDTLLALQRATIQRVASAILAVTVLALIVAGAVVANTILISVTERAAEVALRRAVGASRKDIFIQFVVESLALSLCGGLAGALAGSLAAAGIGLIVAAENAGFEAMARPTTALVGLGAAVAVGLAAGVYPARRAALLDPIVGLRQE